MGIKSALSWINLADLPGVTFTASSEIANLPASNLADEDVNQVWGVSGLGSDQEFYVDVDLIYPSTIGVVCLVLGWRLDRPEKIRQTKMMAASDLIQITIDGAGDDFGDGAAADTGEVECNIQANLGYYCWPLTAPVTGQKIRVRIDALSRASEGFWWGARLWVGPRMDFIRGHQFGHTEKWDENAFEEAIRTPSIPFQRVKDLNSELDNLLEFEQLTLKSRQMLFIRDLSKPNQTSLIGKRNDTSGFQSSFPKNYGFVMQVQETW